MSVTRPTTAELFDSITYVLNRRLGVTNFGDSSIAGTIAKVILEQMDNLWAKIEEVDRESNLLTATGANLDRIGESRGVFRQDALPNHSIGSIGATFTNIGNSAITVPVGTSVWCSTRPNSKFTTLYTTTVPAGSSVDLAILSEGLGDFYNVLPGDIDRCDLGSDYISVTNRYSIYNGSNGETDADYRERIIRFYASFTLGSEDSIREALRNVPGVRDVKLYSTKRGPGTLDILLIPRSAEVTSELISMCGLVARQRVSPGVDYRILTPFPKELDISVQVLLNNNAPISDFTRTAITNSIRYFVDNISSTATSVSLPALISDLHRTDSSITSLSVSTWIDGSPIDSGATIYLDESEVLTVGTIEVR